MTSKAKWSFFVLVPIVFFYLFTTNFYALTYLFPNFNFYDAKRFLQLILLAYFILLLGIPYFREKWGILLAKLPRATEWILGAFFMLGIWSACLAIFKEEAFLLIGFYFLLVVVIAFIASNLMNSSQLLNIGLVVAIWLGIVSYLIVFATVFISWYPIFKQTGYSIFQHVVFPGFVNERFFSQFQDWTMGFLPLPLIFCLKKRPVYVPLLFILAAAWWALLFYDAALGEEVGFLLSAILLGLIFRKFAMQWLLWQGVLALAGWNLYYFFFVILLRNSLQNLVRTDHERWLIWKNALLLIKQHPWLGVGPMNYSHFPDPTFQVAHPHNSLLLLAAEWGIPATVAIIFLAIKGLYAFIKQFNHRSFIQMANSNFEQLLLISLFFSLMMALAHSFVSGVFVMPLSQMTAVIVIGWLLGLYYQNNSVNNGNTLSRSHIWILVGLSFAALLLIAVIVGPQLPNLAEQEAAWMQAHPNITMLHPRFWVQGLL